MVRLNIYTTNIAIVYEFKELNTDIATRILENIELLWPNGCNVTIKDIIENMRLKYVYYLNKGELDFKIELEADDDISWELPESGYILDIDKIIFND